MQYTEITNLRSAEYVHDRARAGCILGGNEVAMVIVSKCKCGECPGDDDVTEAEHREPTLSAECERLRP
jgi:hypothetical protein